MKRLGAVILICAALWMGLRPQAPAAAQTAAVVAAAPADLELGTGMTGDLAIEVRDVQNLYGIDLTVGFDPAAVEVVDADPALAGTQVSLGVFLESGIAVINQADNAAGRIHFVMTQLNPAEPKSGSGNLLVIRFRGKQAGSSSPLTLVDVQLATRDGEAINASLQEGRIRVVAQVSGPTATPIPVQDPGSIQMMPTLSAAEQTAAPQNTPLPADASPTAAAQPGEATAAQAPEPAPVGSGGGQNWWLLLVLAVLVAGMGALYLRTRSR